jgi:hypothetical protein
MIRPARSPIWTLGVGLLAIAARAEWTIQSEDSEPGRGGIEHRHLVLQNASAGDRALVDLAVFSSKSCTLRLIDNSSGAPLAETARREKILAGVNGGYFDADFAPIGLRISDGKQVAPLQRAKLLTGLLIASPREVQIIRARQFSPKEKLAAAVQCGPFLVDGGRGVPGLDDSRPARRTFALTATSNHGALGVCSEVTLAQLAEILATLPLADDFKTQRALNLDGGSSTAFWFRRESGGAFSIPEQKPLRDFVAVVSE